MNKAWLLLTTKLKRAVKSYIPLRNWRSFQIHQRKRWNNNTRDSLFAKKLAYVNMECQRVKPTRSNMIEFGEVQRTHKAE